MPAPTPKPTTKQEGGAPANSVNGSSPDLVALLSSSDILQQLLRIDIENKQLKQRNSDLEVTNRTNIDTIAEKRSAWSDEKAALERELQAKLDEMKSLRYAKNKVDELSGQVKQQEIQLLSQGETIKKKGAEITRHQALCQKAKEELDLEKTSAKVLSDSLRTLKQDLSCKKEELAKANDSLADVQSFAVQLRPMAAGKAQVKRALDNTFHQFLTFFHDELSADLAYHSAPTDVIEKLSIPLPASNSAAARQMRVVAALAVCGDALDRHIFRQAFVGDDLHQLLETLVVDHPKQESRVRAVLLKLLEVFPDDKKAVQEANVDSAVKEIVGALGKWVQPTSGFDARLRPLCAEAAEAWNKTLALENRVVARSVSWPEHGHPVPLEVPDKRKSQPNATNSSQNNNKSQTTPATTETAKKQQQQQQQQQAAGPAQTSQSQRPAQRLSRNEVLKPVWPVFIAHPITAADDDDDDDDDDDGGDEEPAAEFEVLSYGYVLTKAQALEAEEEVSREQSPFKLARQNTRRQQTAVPKKRRNSMVLPAAGRGSSVASSAG
ncbi:hypothetical protein V2A60_004174 [Cordyceps javanica]|uniref:MEI5 protein n=1 Tax=Cordyceps javanica TaxID=43265 RepID=A0A545VKS5_9HYPO|nr:MEI5 protein [Cordyceps javanica]TQW02333.1 hypothetical protein IF2G_10136 [Cordyceps javanica]